MAHLHVNKLIPCPIREHRNIEVRVGNFVCANFGMTGPHEGLLVTCKLGHGRENAIDKLGEANMVFCFSNGPSSNKPGKNFRE